MEGHNTEETLLSSEKINQLSDTKIGKPTKKGEPDVEEVLRMTKSDSQQEDNQIFIKKSTDSEPCPRNHKTKIARNQSDIFSLKQSEDNYNSIFSVNGSPSRRVFKKQEPQGHIFEKTDSPLIPRVSSAISTKVTKDEIHEKRPSSSFRNPLTGSGLSSKDEYKGKASRRRDGNPLLGVGYDDETLVRSNQRIPPGGHAHKLW